MVTSRTPDDAQMARRGEWAGLTSVKLIGDAAAPGPIAWATYAGRRDAEDLDEPDCGDALRFRREIAELAAVGGPGSGRGWLSLRLQLSSLLCFLLDLTRVKSGRACRQPRHGRGVLR